MRTKTTLIIALAFLAFALSACSFSYSTASISSLDFGKNKQAAPPATTFNVGEMVYAVAGISLTTPDEKIRFNLIYENVQGKAKGEIAATKEIVIGSSSSANFFFSTPTPGEYKVEAILTDPFGKEMDKKSGTVTIKGGAANTSATEPKTDDSKTDDSDDKSEDK
jgi:hypothetical protein